MRLLVMRKSNLCFCKNLQACAAREPEMYVALYADETVPYREIVKILNIANENQFKMVLATRQPEE